MMMSEDRFYEIINKMKKTHEDKSHDYGNEDPYANLRECEKMGIPAWHGVIIRMHDKMARMNSLCCKGELKNESIEDTFQDMAIYAIIARILYEEANG